MVVETRRPEDLGGMGEGYFRMIAKAASLVVNDAQEDKAGWDFIVEAPSPLQTDFASHSKPVYRVQVKSTSGTLSAVGMTYSSLLSLIRHGGPSFVLLLKFGKGDAPDGAALLHLDEETSTEILTSLRRKQVANPALKINKSTHSLRFPIRTVIAPCTGASFRLRLESFFPDGYLAYVEHKTQWLRKLEAQGTQMFASIRIEGEANLRAMANSFLGFDAPFELASKAYVAPMGIPDGDVSPTVVHPTSIRPIESKLPQGTLTLRSSQFGARYDFRAKVYATPEELPIEVRAMRFRTALFSLVADLGRGTIGFHTVDLADKTIRSTVREFRNLLAFAGSLSDSSSSVVEFQMDDGQAPQCSPLGMPPAAFGELREFHPAFEKIFVHLAGLGVADDVVAPSHLFEIFEMLDIVAFAGANVDPPLECEFVAEAPHELDASTAVVQVPIELLSNTVIFFLALRGSISSIGGDRFQGQFIGTEYLSAIVVPKTQDGQSAALAHTNELRRSLRGRGLQVV